MPRKPTDLSKSIAEQPSLRATPINSERSRGQPRLSRSLRTDLSRDNGGFCVTIKVHIKEQR